MSYDDVDSVDNVVKIDGQRKTKASSTTGKREKSNQESSPPKQEPAPPKPKMVIRQHAVVDAIQGDILANSFPPFPMKFHTIIDNANNKQILVEHDNQVVSSVGIQALKTAIARYTKFSLAGFPGYYWNSSQTSDCAKMWLDESLPIPMPAIFRWKHEGGLAFHRFAFDYTPDVTLADFPIWEERVFSRCSNREAFIAAIGSWADISSPLHQYLWIYGDGGNGKSAVMRALGEAFGAAYTAARTPSRNGSNHWGTFLLQARLVCFPECEDPTFPISDLFKGLTGADPFTINPKGKEAFTIYPKAKFVILSNHKPAITGEAHDMRRIIPVEFAPFTGKEDEHHEEKLRSEIGAVISYCYRYYREHYPTHKRIEVDEDVVDSIVSQQTEEFEHIFEVSFRHSNGGVVKGSEMGGVVKQHFKSANNTRTQRFRDWLVREKNVIKSRGPNKTVVYRGIALREMSDNIPWGGVGRT